MVDLQVSIVTASRPGLTVDTGALCQALTQEFDLSGVALVGNALLRFQNDDGLTQTMRGQVTEAGFLVTHAGRHRQCHDPRRQRRRPRDARATHSHFIPRPTPMAA